MCVFLCGVSGLVNGPLAIAQGDPQAAPAVTTIDRAFISFRIGVPQWMSDERYAALLELFEQYKGVTDEITFFTSATHPPLPLDEIERRCGILARRVAQAKQLGYRAGINVLATMGHHNENLPNSLSGDYTRVTDIDGNVSLGSCCPNDPLHQEYVRQLYRLVAQANPDFIWIDDDIRLSGSHADWTHLLLRPVSGNVRAGDRHEVYSSKFENGALRRAGRAADGPSQSVAGA